MITNAERREAAAELRKYNYAYLDTEGYISLRIPCNRLADLIEPEPERTCTLIYRGEGKYPACSKCYELVPWSIKYCSECGAKVVK